MSGVESLLHGSWSWLLRCDAMTDVVLLQTVHKVLHRKHIRVVLDSQREGLLVEMVNTGHLVGPGRLPQSPILRCLYVVVCLPRPMEGMGRLQFSDLFFTELPVPPQAPGVVGTFNVLDILLSTTVSRFFGPYGCHFYLQDLLFSFSFCIHFHFASTLCMCVMYLTSN